MWNVFSKKKVSLRLTYQAYHLLREEHPLTRPDLVHDPADEEFPYSYIGTVYSWIGIGRFVLGLPGQVRVEISGLFAGTGGGIYLVKASLAGRRFGYYDVGTAFMFSFLSSAMSGAFLAFAASSAVAYRPDFFEVVFSLTILLVAILMRLQININIFQRDQKTLVGFIRLKGLDCHLGKPPNVKTLSGFL